MISSRGNQMDLDSDEFDLFDDTSSEPSRRHHSSVASKPMDFSCSQVRLDFSSSSAFELFWSELRLPSPSSSLSMLAEFSQSNVSVITRLSNMCTEWKQAILPFTIVHSIFSTASSTQSYGALQFRRRLLKRLWHVAITNGGILLLAIICLFYRSFQFADGGDWLIMDSEIDLDRVILLLGEVLDRAGHFIGKMEILKFVDMEAIHPTVQVPVGRYDVDV